MLEPPKLSVKSHNLSFGTHIVSLWYMICPPDPKINRKSTYAALCPVPPVPASLYVVPPSVTEKYQLQICHANIEQLTYQFKKYMSKNLIF